ncbi:site-specific DNA-methyltransferase [Allofranklinella schreckenbergeri]|uniref:site-specific DNA-methyltransferase (adenine-specific) n=1 Tax=Allofranklinella schreckenbergeri TaxID=1076744 RepID=A0A3M6R9M3_9BURK|nr:site-specific DNA-methyltransferase [Allofranklinella schreckenbergeri]RMX11599.1 site-specific DNA-methyltransferase [Allofranklinella schreckenbergeri]
MAVPIPKKRKYSDDSKKAAIFRLEYPEKKSVEEILSTPIRQYTPNANYIGGKNRLYHADNLSVLSALVQDESVLGKVKLVYIDPPFATGSDFESRNQKHAYEDHLTGSNFIESLRERLILIHHLLADDGSLYLHLDERMAFYFRIVLDEIFGEKNFRCCITRRKCNPKNYTRNNYGNVADYILFYTKSNRYIWNRPVEEWDDARAMKEYQYIDVDGRRYKKVPIHAPGVRNGETGKSWRGMLPPPGKHWQYPPSTLDEMDARGEIYWSSTGNPRRKVYLEDSTGIPVQNIWLDFKDPHNQNIHITGYPTEKNPNLLERIISASSNPGDLVMDCYSGSGTTLAVAAALGRQWIGVDRSDEAIRTTLRRFELGTQRMGDFFDNTRQNSLLLHEPITDFTLYEASSRCIIRSNNSSEV